MRFVLVALLAGGEHPAEQLHGASGGGGWFGPTQRHAEGVK